MLPGDKRSSLLGLFISASEKKSFIILTTWCQGCKNFSLADAIAKS
jgi:hypothetical protein